MMLFCFLKVVVLCIFCFQRCMLLIRLFELLLGRRFENVFYEFFDWIGV